MIKNHTLFTGDNLSIMRGMESESVDLIYLDPPFNSNRTYCAPIGSKAAGATFKDTWTLDDTDTAWWGEIADEHPPLYKVIDAAGEVGGKGDKAYLIYMAMRLLELKRILKPTGSIYLHCDQTMSHSLKMTMDSVFGDKNFMNEIVWHYTGGGRSQTYFSRKHDVIFWYAKTKNQQIFNVDEVRVPYKETSGYAKGGIKAKSGKHYKPNPKGTPLDDVWDMPIINPMSKERLGYPTQKPIALLERIIKASSNKNDIVFDPFCGCATTLMAAQKFNRQWIGIDISPKAVELVKVRMENELGLFADFIHREDIPKRKKDIKRTKNIKHILYGEQEGKCGGCRLWFPFRNTTIDHIIPQIKSGTDDDNNLQLLCGSCNSTKGSRELSLGSKR